MSIMGRLAAGLGAGVATLGQKYIDEEVAQQRAQFLADLQRTTASTIRKDDDEFRNDPARVARDRENKRQEVLTAGQAQQEVELSKANNTVLNEAQRRVEDEKAEAEIKRKVEAGKALLPLELERASKLAAADAGTRAKYREKPQTMAEKAAELEAFLGRKLLPEERERFAGLGKKVDVGEVTEKTTENDANGLPVKERTVKRPLMPGELDKPRPTEQQAHAEAEAAIKSGAPRDAVNARLAQAGYKPLGGAADKPGMSPGAERGARKPVAPTGPVAVAESQLRQATERLNSYGSSQRQRDPDGFRQAQAQVAEARAALAAAQESEAGPVTDSDRRPSTRYAAP